MNNIGRISPLTLEQFEDAERTAVSHAEVHPVDETLENRRANANVAQALRYAIQESREPSDAEIETVARAIDRSFTPGSDENTIWRAYTSIARTAIRAIRGLDGKATP